MRPIFSHLGIEFQVATQLTRRLQRDCIVRNKSRRKKASTNQYTVVKSENSKRHFAFWMSQVSFQSVGGGETASLTTTTPVAACVIDADATAVVKNNSKANKNSKKVSVASLPATGGGCGGGGARRLRTGKEF